MQYTVQIKEHHLDTFGHVNNAVYLELLEEARWELITERGYGLKEVLKYKKGPIVLEMNIKFLKELKLREKIQITFEFVAGGNGKIGHGKQQMINEKNEVCCEASITMGFFDLDARKLILPTNEWKKVIEI